MTITYRAQYVRCGKKNCRSCPHGPYWYGFWKEGGRTRSKYVGKVEPNENTEAPPRMAESRTWLKILKQETASVALACEILEVDEITSKEIALKSYRRLCLIHHPDRGGDENKMKCLNAAWSYLKAYQCW